MERQPIRVECRVVVGAPYDTEASAADRGVRACVARAKTVVRLNKLKHNTGAKAGAVGAAARWGWSGRWVDRFYFVALPRGR